MAISVYTCKPSEKSTFGFLNQSLIDSMTWLFIDFCMWQGLLYAGASAGVNSIDQGGEKKKEKGLYYKKILVSIGVVWETEMKKCHHVCVIY